MKKKVNKVWNFPRIVFCIFLLFLVLLSVQLCYLAISPDIYSINMDEFAAKRNTVTQVLTASRGTIYDKDKNVLALNVTSYTVIAYLSEKRTGKNPTPLHVVDKDKTAEALAPLINMKKEDILKLLNKKVYQVELGPGGRGISELTKSKIAALNLPGIDFIESHKRYFPNGDFASYIIGYAKENEDGVITGELGIEAKYNEVLKGTDGYVKYQRDRFGYKIPDTKEERVESIDGDDIYLTIDSNIQRFVESAVKDASSAAHPDWMIISVMDAKTGKILANTSTPTFNPNTKNISSYENPLVSYLYEPGSIMKTYTYMCAIEKGTYNGSSTYDSSGITFTDDTITDWNTVGFGTITFDKGYEYSSNVGVSNMMQRFLSKKDLKECFTKYGFGKQTGIELSRELSGNISFRYPIEVASASFGQGITSTVIQQLQALTIISNDGKMLKPHVVDKIIDSKTGKVTYEAKNEESERLVSTKTVEKIKELMYNVINGTDAYTTGKAYKIDGFDLIGKTGTAQYVDSKTGKYIRGSYIYSFAGMFPKDEPEIIILGVLANPETKNNDTLKSSVREVLTNIATYKGMFEENKEEEKKASFLVSNYRNKEAKDVKETLEKEGVPVAIIGNGDKIIDQYPKANENILKQDMVILKTNGNEKTMPNMTGWSSKTAENYLKLANISYKTEGYGYVIEQSIKEGDGINNQTEVTLKYAQKFGLE